jgi:hypothetical protein
MQFKFFDCGGPSGWMTFTDSSGVPLLLVTDAGHDAVHMIDVKRGKHAGFLVPPGAIAGPRGVATRAQLVAVSSWKPHQAPWDDPDMVKDLHIVQIFACSRPGRSYYLLRKIVAGLLWRPLGLRFSRNGHSLAVADGFGRLCLFNMTCEHRWGCASFNCRPRDVEEVHDGWLVATDSGVVKVCKHTLVAEHVLTGLDLSSRALTFIPHVGLVVREDFGLRVTIYSATDFVTMSGMAECRVAWIVAVVRVSHVTRNPFASSTPKIWGQINRA